MFKKPNCNSPFFPMHKNDFNPKKIYYVFWCICKEEGLCVCDMSIPENYHECIVFGLGDSDTDWEKMKLEMRAAFPTMPQEPSDDEDVVVKDKLRKVKKTNSVKEEKKKNSARTIQKIKDGKLKFGSVSNIECVTIPEVRQRKQADTTHIKSLLQTFRASDIPLQPMTDSSKGDEISRDSGIEESHIDGNMDQSPVRSEVE
ncbi:hypothetical protein QAD02_000080 [Eretmocerus hayati]|uniref:Uncharacterized protein n=1 Tax=Eretmocerus hayati TaxID=131215 RepID=A0ACC2ND30_9HYME|nr:hypothetical protein QAD02_000080 [Eretmocerus hayati]